MSQTQLSDHETLSASPRLFDNDLLDKFSRVHWSMPLVIYIPVGLFLLWVSLSIFSPLFTLGAVALGYAIWTLIEYFGHRYLFHTVFPGKLGERLHFLMHGVHHVHPNDPLRLVMPPLLSAPILGIALLVGIGLFGLPNAYPILLGFLIGYLVYDMTHYYLHHAEPKTRLGISMRRAHMLHHFRDPNKGYGVAAVWWDHVFNTAFETPKRER